MERFKSYIAKKMEDKNMETTNLKTDIVIVAADENLRNSLMVVCDQLKMDAIQVKHSEAMRIIGMFNPEVILICDCDRNGEGVETFTRTKEEFPRTRILRLGFSRNNGVDYLQMPFKIEQLKEKLKGGK